MWDSLKVVPIHLQDILLGWKSVLANSDASGIDSAGSIGGKHPRHSGQACQ